MEPALIGRLPRCREGGLRGLSWIIAPGAVKAGGRYPNLAHVSDWLPTLTAAAGIDMGTVGAGFEELDGVSHWAALTSSDGDSVGGPPRTEILFNIVSSMPLNLESSFANSGASVLWAGWDQRHGHRGAACRAAQAAPLAADKRRRRRAL